MRHRSRNMKGETSTPHIETVRNPPDGHARAFVDRRRSGDRTCSNHWILPGAARSDEARSISRLVKLRRQRQGACAAWDRAVWRGARRTKWWKRRSSSSSRRKQGGRQPVSRSCQARHGSARVGITVFSNLRSPDAPCGVARPTEGSKKRQKDATLLAARLPPADFRDVPLTVTRCSTR